MVYRTRNELLMKMRTKIKNSLLFPHRRCKRRWAEKIIKKQSAGHCWFVYYHTIIKFCRGWKVLDKKFPHFLKIVIRQFIQLGKILECKFSGTICNKEVLLLTHDFLL